jgi:Winged helix DNA-binding domain
MTVLSEVALLRLIAQGIAGPQPRSPVAAVRRLLALQGQDFPGALTSVALRTAELRRDDVLAALDDGSVVRSWPMRGTLHLLAADDLPWMLRLLGPRSPAGLTARWAELGLSEGDAERARDLVTAALSGGRRLLRADLLTVLDDGGMATTGQRGYHLLGYLARTGTLCLGPTTDGEQLFVLVDEWIPAPSQFEGEEALAELARRYFLGHGPATIHDLARWAGIGMRSARAGLAAVRDQLSSLEVDGVEYLMDPSTPDLLDAHRAEARGLFLLPGFDEFVLGYRERGAVLDPQFAERIVPGGNGMFRPTVVRDGRLVGTWQWTGRGASRAVSATPFTSFPDEVTTALPDLAARLR